MTVLEGVNFGAVVHVEIILLAKKLERCLIAFYFYLSKVADNFGLDVIMDFPHVDYSFRQYHYSDYDLCIIPCS